MDWSLLGALLKLVAALAIGVPLAAYLMQDKLIFLTRPLSDTEHRAIAARHPDVADVFLQAADGTRVHAWHLKAADKAPLVLYFGGNAEEVSWLLDELPRRKLQAGWLLVDYRGYGSSGGAPSERALNADALAWYDYGLKTGAQIFAFGRSLGSGVAVHLAAERPLAGLVLVAPFDSLEAVARHHYPFLPVKALLKHRFDSAALAPRLTAPLLCIVASHDQVIPAAHAKRLYDAWGGPKRWLALPGGHNETDNQTDYWPAVQAFLAAR
jgi:pimeloyl-ACP methyl ester carboxylesterase